MQEPLRKIITFAERLVTKYEGLIDEDGKIYFNRMMKAAGNMKTLIESLLEFSGLRIKNQKPDLVDLDKIFKEVVNDLEILIEEAKAVVVSARL